MDVSHEVLIVEDDDATRSLLGVIVQYYGFRPSFAADGAAALARLHAKPPALLVLDLLLPRVNGFEILRELKRTSPALLRRTVVVTAASERTIADCAELREVWKVLRKPLDIDELASELTVCAAAAESQPHESANTRIGDQRERETS